MKPVLFYAIRRISLYNPVIAVTSVKGNRWFGRDCMFDNPTHGINDDLMGHFNTLEDAQKLRDDILKINRACEAACKVHNNAVSRLHREARMAVEVLIKENTNDPQRA